MATLVDVDAVQDCAQKIHNKLQGLGSTCVICFTAYGPGTVDSVSDVAERSGVGFDTDTVLAAIKSLERARLILVSQTPNRQKTIGAHGKEYPARIAVEVRLS